MRGLNLGPNYCGGVVALLGLGVAVVFGVEVVVELVVSVVVAAGLCFLDLVVVALVVVEFVVVGLLAEVSVPLAVAEGAVLVVVDRVVVDEEPGGLDGGAIGVALVAPELDVVGAAEGAMGSSGAGCALAAPPRAVEL